jgi:divalent metal cation (Fe/Co/Zn/Cd) transporter
MVPADWEVRRGHEVASAIEYEIEQALGEGNATAHIEPCKDGACETCEKADKETRRPGDKEKIQSPTPR